MPEETLGKGEFVRKVERLFRTPTITFQGLEQGVGEVKLIL